MSTATATPAASPTANPQQAASLDAWGMPVAGGNGGMDPNWSGGTVDPFAGFDNFDGSEAKVGGGLIDCEGAYHLEIADADLRKDKDGNVQLNHSGRHEIRCRMVCVHSTPGQSPAGSAMWYGIEIPNAEDKTTETKNGGNMFAALSSAIGAFCLGVGIFVKRTIDGKEVIVDQETGTTKWNLRTLAARLKGRQVIGRPKRRDFEYTDKKTEERKNGFEMEFKWGHGVSQIGDPQNAMVPMNEEAAKAGGLSRFAGPSPATQAAANGGAKRQAKAVAAGTAQPTSATAPTTGPATTAPAPADYSEL